MDNSALVSVIMPAYNSSNTIDESIRSVINQTYTNWELIVVNDGSADNTKDIIARYAQSNQKVKVIDLAVNAGLPNARNVGVEHSSGNWIAFLDSDDYWTPDKITRQIQYHSTHPNVLISHTNYTTFTTDVTQSKKLGLLSSVFDKKEGLLLNQLLWKNSVAVLTVMMQRDLFVSVGGFNTSLKTFEDADLWIKVSLTNHKFGYLEEQLAAYRISQGGISRTLGKYKRAYKKFLQLYNSILIENNVKRKALGNYYRYFGTEYYKLEQYALASSYFKASMSLFGFHYLNILNTIYLCLLATKVKKNA